jgi:hypothetical protein
MPITATNPFKGRHFPGEVILLCVRWYLRYPLAYQHVAELLLERGVAVDASCIWRWVQTPFFPQSWLADFQLLLFQKHTAGLGPLPDNVVLPDAIGNRCVSL